MGADHLAARSRDLAPIELDGLSAVGSSPPSGRRSRPLCAMPSVGRVSPRCDRDAGRCLGAPLVGAHQMGDMADRSQPVGDAAGHQRAAPRGLPTADGTLAGIQRGGAGPCRRRPSPRPGGHGGGLVRHPARDFLRRSARVPPVPTTSENGSTPGSSRRARWRRSDCCR